MGTKTRPSGSSAGASLRTEQRIETTQDFLEEFTQLESGHGRRLSEAATRLSDLVTSGGAIYRLIKDSLCDKVVGILEKEYYTEDRKHAAAKIALAMISKNHSDSLPNA